MKVAGQVEVKGNENDGELEGDESASGTTDEEEASTWAGWKGISECSLTFLTTIAMDPAQQDSKDVILT